MIEAVINREIEPLFYKMYLLLTIVSLVLEIQTKKAFLKEKWLPAGIIL